MGLRRLSLTMSMFNIPKYQFVSRRTNSLCIDDNKSNNKDLNKLLLIQGDSVIDNSMELYQEQRDFSSVVFDLDDSVGSSDHNIEDGNVPDYSEKISLFKRSHQLCINNQDHEEMYTLLHKFVARKELDNNDNSDVLNNREYVDTVMISSNKIIYKTNPSSKIKKASYEK